MKVTQACLVWTILVVSLSATSSLCQEDNARARPALAPDVQTLQIPSVAFTGMDNNAENFKLQSQWLTQSHGDTQWYFAPITLPHGTSISRIAMVALDDGPKDIALRLVRTPFTSMNETILKSITTSGVSGSFQEITSTAIAKTMNTRKYFYYLWVRLPSSGGNNYWFKGALVHFKNASW